MADFLKDYEPVEDRLRAFWEDHPDGRVMTTLIDHHAGSYIVRAEVFTGDGLDWPAASGLAHDSEDQLPPNMKTSALEVCETSAIGRALANLGYAAKGKRPSREEMSKTSGPEAGVDSQAAPPAQDPGPDTTPASQGEVAAVPGPGELSAKTSPGSTIYPLDPAKCSHKFPSGRWLKWDENDRCPRCGTPKISAVEGTTADLSA